jgi:hypothetical protein
LGLDGSGRYGLAALTGVAGPCFVLARDGVGPSRSPHGGRRAARKPPSIRGDRDRRGHRRRRSSTSAPTGSSLGHAIAGEDIASGGV